MTEASLTSIDSLPTFVLSYILIQADNLNVRQVCKLWKETYTDALFTYFKKILPDKNIDTWETFTKILQEKHSIVKEQLPENLNPLSIIHCIHEMYKIPRSVLLLEALKKLNQKSPPAFNIKITTEDVARHYQNMPPTRKIKGVVSAIFKIFINA